MSEPRIEKRLLLDLQVIQAGAGPAPAVVTQQGGFAPRPRSRRRMLDAEMAALLHVLGLLTEVEVAAIVAQD